MLLVAKAFGASEGEALTATYDPMPLAVAMVSRSVFLAIVSFANDSVSAADCGGYERLSTLH